MLNMQNVKDIEITEGNVRTIHDKDNKLIWGRLAYDTKYAGDTEQQTYSGKNLFNKNNYNLFNGYLSGNPTGTIVANANNDIFYIPCQPNTTYSISKTTSLNFAVACSTVIPSNGSAFTGRVSGNSAPNLTITTDATASCLIVWARNGDIDGEISRTEVLNTLQIEIGSPTAYEPYVGGIPSPNPDYPQDVNVVTGTQTVTISDGVDSEDYTISLGTIELCKIGTYQDYIYKSGDDWYVHKATSKYTFTGSETIGKASNTSNNSYYYASSQNPNYGFSDIDRTHMTSGSGSTAVIPIYSKYFGENSSNNIVSTDSIGIGFNLSGTSGIDCRIGVGLSSSINTANLLKTWLTNNTLTVYYPLASPNDTQIADTNLITQLNNIHQFLTRYGYNSNVTGNLPIIINQTSL